MYQDPPRCTRAVPVAGPAGLRVGAYIGGTLLDPRFTINPAEVVENVAGLVTGGDAAGADEGLRDIDRRYVLLRPVAVDVAATTFPCGMCPVAKACAPGGIVAPETCVYFTQWLDA